MNVNPRYCPLEPSIFLVFIHFALPSVEIALPIWETKSVENDAPKAIGVGKAVATPLQAIPCKPNNYKQ